MTTRTAVLMRHAKAETPDGISDLDRPLARRGASDAADAGSWLAGRELYPDLVLCSPARRTRETWHAVASALAEEGLTAPEVRYERTLYAGNADDLLDLIRTVSDEFTTVLVVGHNPTISDASNRLAAGDAIGAFTGLKTSGLAVHRCTGPWSSLGPETTELVERHTARA